MATSREDADIVTSSVERRKAARQASGALRVQLLGPLSVARGGTSVTLPKSRKARALIAYLALSTREVTRSRLCELLWDAPSDPRGELRWCLSRVRAVLDDETRTRVSTRADCIALDLKDCDVDVLEISRALDAGLETLTIQQLRELAGRFAGDLLEGLHVDNSPSFEQWIASERRRLHVHQVAVLRELVRRLPAEDGDSLRYLGQWLKADPLDRSAHEQLLTTLVQRGQLREAEEHLAATIRLFELEGLDWISIREAWRSARNRARTPVVTVTSSIEPETKEIVTAAARRASICVMPFLQSTPEGLVRHGAGDGLADDIITRLARLRALFVIARATAFSLAERGIGAEEAARILNVDYVASGVVRTDGDRICVKVELVDGRRSGIVWTDEFECAQEDAHAGLAEAGSGIVACIAGEVEAAERNRAILKPPSSLDAWEAYHRGLWHMYRFNATDNDRAEHFFRLSTQLDPTFARAHAGLSFTHFQNAFLHRTHERARHAAEAFEAAGQSMLADDRDPAAHCAMGRALWLRGDESDSIDELARSVDLSPNFALGHYSLGFVHSQSGDASAAIAASDYSRQLSPFDPLMFAMLATRALAKVRLGEFDEAANWALKAAGRPNAHVHILAIAAHSLAFANRVDEARNLVARIRKAQPDYSVADFLRAFHFAPDAQEMFRQGARVIGFAHP